MAEKKKGRAPDYRGSGVAIWKNRDESGREYLTVQLCGKNGICVNCFPVK